MELDEGVEVYGMKVVEEVGRLGNWEGSGYLKLENNVHTIGLLATKVEYVGLLF